MGTHASNSISVPALLNINNSIIEIPTPMPNIMASTGLSIPNINNDFFVLAGIKEPFILYHTPFFLINFYFR